MLTIFISLNKYMMKIYLMVHLMMLIMYHKYNYFLIYVWSKLKMFNFLGSENDIYFRMEGVLLVSMTTNDRYTCAFD